MVTPDLQSATASESLAIIARMTVPSPSVAQPISSGEAAQSEIAGEILSDIPADLMKKWQEKWAIASPTGFAPYYSGQVALDAFLRPSTALADDPIPGILPRGEVMTLVGRTSSGKTTLAVGLAVDKTLGEPIFGAWACQPGVVAYATAEDLDGWARRYSAALAYRRVQAHDAALHLRPRVPRLVIAADAKTRREGGDEFYFYTRAEQYRGNLPLQLDLLIIDYLANAKGDAAENSNDDIGVLMDALNRLAKALDCGVIIIAHPGKNAADDLPRGAQVISDKSYCVAVLRGRPEDDAPQELEFLKNPKNTRKPIVLGFKMTEIAPDLPYMVPAATHELTTREKVMTALRSAHALLTGDEIADAADMSDAERKTLPTTLLRMTRGDKAEIVRHGGKPFRYGLKE